MSNLSSVIPTKTASDAAWAAKMKYVISLNLEKKDALNVSHPNS